MISNFNFMYRLVFMTKAIVILLFNGSNKDITIN